LDNELCEVKHWWRVVPFITDMGVVEVAELGVVDGSIARPLSVGVIYRGATGSLDTVALMGCARPARWKVCGEGESGYGFKGPSRLLRYRANSDPVCNPKGQENRVID